MLRTKVDATAARGFVGSVGGNFPESKQISLLGDNSEEPVEMLTFAVFDSFIMLLISLSKFFSNTRVATGSGDEFNMFRSMTSYTENKGKIC